jgi:hypothetical protein
MIKASATTTPATNLVTNKKSKKRRRQKDIASQGRWTDEEHKKFVEGKHRGFWSFTRRYKLHPIFSSFKCPSENSNCFGDVPV